MLLALANVHGTHPYPEGSQASATQEVAVVQTISSNPMLVHAGRMMTRGAATLYIWDIVKDTL